MEMQVVGTVDLGNKVQVFMSDPIYSGLGQARKKTGEYSYWWLCMGKAYWASYVNGNKSLKEVLGHRMFSRTSLETVMEKLGKEALCG